MEHEAKAKDIQNSVCVNFRPWYSNPLAYWWQYLSDPDFRISSDAFHKALVRKQDLRILPLSALSYFILNIDRSNVGNAKTMNAETQNDLLSETNMSEQEYIISLMVFFIIYA